MENGKEMTEEILAKVAALADGELPESERDAVRALVASSPALTSELAFLERLREATLADSDIRMPVGLSERIAAATYARPTIWNRLAASLAPSPTRYAFGGVALSGVAALCWVMLRPSLDLVPPTPASSPAPEQVAVVAPTPAPKARLPEVTRPVAPTPASIEKPVVVAAIPKSPPISIPAPTPEFSTPEPDMSALPMKPKKTGLVSAPKSVASTPAPSRPAAAPKLPPARFVEPTEGELVVADSADTIAPASTSGEIKTPSESEPLTAQPRTASVSVVTTPVAAALNGDLTKISLANLPQEKGSALSGKPTVGAIGSRMSLVNDGVRN